LHQPDVFIDRCPVAIVRVLWQDSRRRPGLRGRQESAMDFIERLLGISPDGGSGSLELLLFAILICGNIYLAVKRRLRKQRMPSRLLKLSLPA
jgi:hypothetical protein